MTRANMRAQHTGPPWTVLQCATESSREPVVVTEPKCHEGKPGRRITPIEGKTSAQNKLNKILGSRCSVKSTAWLALLPFCSKFFFDDIKSAAHPTPTHPHISQQLPENLIFYSIRACSISSNPRGLGANWGIYLIRVNMPLNSSD